MQGQASRRPPVALITGASSGIGEAYARCLATEGYRLVLVARRAERLDALAAELRETHGIDAAALPADLSKWEDMERVAACIEALPPLGLLVNNAGFGIPGSFATKDPQAQLAMVSVHCSATVRLCRAALPAMLQRRSGGIINVSSIAGLVPSVAGPLYGSTKTFLIRFSEILQSEIRGSGVTVQALCPGLVLTEFHETPAYEGFDRDRFPRWMWMTAEDVVRESLAALGRGGVIFVPGRRYRLLLAVANNPIVRPLVGKMMESAARKEQSNGPPVEP